MTDTMTTTTSTITISAHKRSWAERLRLTDYSGVYALVILFIVYTVTMPEVFPTVTTLRTLLADQAVIGILAVAAIIPFVAGLVDLSFAALAGFSLVLTTWLSGVTQFGFFGDALIAVSACILLGSISGFMIARLGLDSLIVTLGVSTLAVGLSEAISGGDTLVAHVDRGIVNAVQGSIGPIPFLAIAFLILAVLAYIWLEHTVPGRNLYAVGSNPTAARLAGIGVAKYRFFVMIFAAAISGIAGVLLTAKIGSATSAMGSAYLLPALAIIFLGATQVRRGVNIPGMLIAIAVIGTLIKGLQLAGAASWVNPAANGVVLLIALAMTTLNSRSRERAL